MKLILGKGGTEWGDWPCLPLGILGRSRGNSRAVFESWALKEVSIDPVRVEFACEHGFPLPFFIDCIHKAIIDILSHWLVAAVVFIISVLITLSQSGLS